MLVTGKIGRRCPFTMGFYITDFHAMSRLQNIVSKYNDVDPEEHRLLKVKLEEQSATASQAAAAHAQLEKELQSKIKEVSEELATAMTRSTVFTYLLSRTMNATSNLSWDFVYRSLIVKIRTCERSCELSLSRKKPQTQILVGRLLG